MRVAAAKRRERLTDPPDAPMLRLSLLVLAVLGTTACSDAPLAPADPSGAPHEAPMVATRPDALGRDAAPGVAPDDAAALAAAPIALADAAERIAPTLGARAEAHAVRAALRALIARPHAASEARHAAPLRAALDRLQQVDPSVGAEVETIRLALDAAADARTDRAH
jgi:hypothetical protein